MAEPMSPLNLRRTVSSVLLCALLVLDPVRLLGQQTAAGFGEVLDVRVMNVDVVATDSRGNAVAGLTQGDFEIYEDGKRQEITNFYEVTAASVADTARATAAPGTVALAPASSRKFIFYVDNGTLSVKNRNEIFPALTAFFEKNLLPGDQAMIVSWNRALNVRLPWTSDRAAIAATLKTLSGELGGAAELQGQKRRVEQLLNRMLAESIQTGEGRSNPGMVTFEVLEANARSYAESVRHDISQSASAMTKLLSSLSGVDGKKVLVLATESLPTQAGAEIFAALENIRRQAMLPGSNSNLAASARGSSSIGDLGKYNITPMIEALARAANATGVTVYAINPKGTDTQNSGKVELQDPARATDRRTGDDRRAGGHGPRRAESRPELVLLDRVSRALGQVSRPQRGSALDEEGHQRPRAQRHLLPLDRDGDGRSRARQSPES
jgi:VWFA-related protein